MALSFIFFFQPAVLCLAGSSPEKASVPAGDEDAELESSLTISGLVLKKEELWDRRTNTLMGRPDILKEILLSVKVISVAKGHLKPDPSPVTISIKSQKNIIKYKSISTGDRGIFRLTGNGPAYELLEFDLIIPAPKPVQGGRVLPVNTPAKVPTARASGDIELERISGRDIIKSKALQEKAVKKIAAKYGMTNASFASMVSFQGPVPPSGGYVHWGVKGQIKGVWHIWQSGKLRQGSELDDPHKYQKCNAPYTLITTPSGVALIKDLKAGDLVISDGAAARIIKSSRVRARNHKVCRIVFANKKILDISPGHPLPDGTLISALKPGDEISGLKILKIDLIPYKFDYTYDILPGSASGTYLANGVLVSSTLK